MVLAIWVAAVISIRHSRTKATKEAREGDSSYQRQRKET